MSWILFPPALFVTSATAESPRRHVPYRKKPASDARQSVFYGLKVSLSAGDRDENGHGIQAGLQRRPRPRLQARRWRRLPSESALSAQLGVSRTTVRKILAALECTGVVTGERAPTDCRQLPALRVQRFPEAETVPMAAQVEKRFMEWMLRDNACPGTAINELELARQFGVATTGIREFLNRFQRFGLIEKRPNAGWVFKGFTPGFALELFEIREMFELRSAKAFAALPKTRRFGSNSRRSARSTSLCWGRSISAFTTFPISTAASTASSIRPRPTGSSTASTTSSR